MLMRKLLTLYFLSLSLYFWAEIPAGYYSSAEGKTGAALKTALCGIVGPHTPRTYTNLWTDFQTTDKRADGKVWDMYSSCNFTFGTNQDSGSHTPECKAYNREHSFPKSWFGGEVSPMYTDLFHLYPTDGLVNEYRSNYPFGEVGIASYTSNNGFSKLGTSSFSGYSGIVFEPNNEYKGDFARTYFYMVSAYDDKVANWSSDQLAGNKYPALSTWSVALFLKWSRQDPVSTKEINRNEAVFGIQHNRNPFIDHPELAEYIWGNHMGELWSLTSSVNEVSIQYSLSPNPVRDEIIINTDEKGLSYAIYNLNGQLILENQLNMSHRIPVSQLNNGMYLLQIKSTSGESVQKFVVSK